MSGQWCCKAAVSGASFASGGGHGRWFSGTGSRAGVDGDAEERTDDGRLIDTKGERGLGHWGAGRSWRAAGLPEGSWTHD